MHVGGIVCDLAKAFDLVWFGLFVHPFSHTCNIGHVSCVSHEMLLAELHFYVI
jgi:hypothetical protein